MSRKLLILVGLALLAAPLPGGAQDPASASPQVDRVFARFASKEAPGCAVAVAKDGRTILARAYGIADLEHDVPNTVETVFEIGSVSKQFTAAAIVLLAQQGKLALTDDARNYVPELPDYGQPVTIIHLLNHTSGLRDWGVLAGIAGWPRGSRVHTHAHVLDIVSRQKALNYPPGARYSYTNTGYNLMAVIVERVSGKSFADFTRAHIFEPLGMTHTQWRDDFTRIVKGRAIAYSPAGATFRLDMPFEDVHGNGGLLTTVGDLIRWNRNFADPKVGGPALVEELQRRGRLTSGREIAYAAGLSHGSHRGVAEVSHGGSTAGYRAFLVRYPGERLDVALICNRGDVNPEALGGQVADVFLPAGPAAQPAVTAVSVPLEELSARAGLYRQLTTGEPARLVTAEGQLRLGRNALVPLSASLFQLGDARVAFEAARGGARAAFRILTPSGDTTAFEPVAEAAPAPEQLAEYAGEYHSDEVEQTFTAAVVDGKLVLKRRPGVVAPLTPAYADVFTNRAGLVRFTRDAAGKVDGMSFSLSRVRDLRFQRR